MKLLLGCVLAMSGISGVFASLDESIGKLVEVGREGQGNEAASAAWKEVVQAGPSALSPVIAATGKGSAVADNWLRLAADVIVANAAREKQPIAAADLEAFIKETAHHASGRELAFELLQRVDRARADALEPSLAMDPVQSLRRGAVQRLIDAAKAKQGEGAADAYRSALNVARDEDQIKAITGELKKLGVGVDLPKHFGFLTKWHVAGPFDNTERKGFETAFPPEAGVKLDATYEGKGKQVKWALFESKDEYGKLDFNKPLGMLKESTAYAFTTIEAPEERDAELRLGCKNAWKVWLNGELLFGRDEYHRGQQMDQYKLKCRLKKGANTVLVKCCQNEQKEDWTVEWEFQLRLCDSAGTAIASAK